MLFKKKLFAGLKREGALAQTTERVGSTPEIGVTGDGVGIASSKSTAGAEKHGEPTPLTRAAPVVLRAVGEPPETFASPVAQAGLGSVAVDILTRPKGEQRALYYQLMDGLYDAVLILDFEGYVVDVNQRVQALLGYSREEAWDLPITKILAGMTRPMLAHLQKSLKDSHNVLIDARCSRKDGSSFPCEVGVSTLNLTKGVNIVLTIRNIERRKNAMLEAARVKTAFEITLAPTFVCNTQGFFVATNQALRELLHFGDEGQNNLRLIEVVPSLAHLFVLAVSGQHVEDRLTLVINQISGTYRIVLMPTFAGPRVTEVSGSLQLLP